MLAIVCPSEDVREKIQWKHLVTFSTITNGVLVKGNYSFVEDFRRNKISTTKERRASFNKSTKLRDTIGDNMKKAAKPADLPAFE